MSRYSDRYNNRGRTRHQSPERSSESRDWKEDENSRNKRSSYFEHRRNLRESAPSVNIWERSPSPLSLRDILNSRDSDEVKPPPSYSSSDEDESPKRKKEKKSKRKSSKKRKSRSPSPQVDSDEERRIQQIMQELFPEKTNQAPGIHETAAVGPMPLPISLSPTRYGSGMLRGEGEAMAQFAEQNKRIPRRGEIGKSSDEIAHFEAIGYVMSGSRNKRMDAMRQLKESQVYVAQEKKSIAVATVAEKLLRENKIVADLRKLASDNVNKKS